MEENETKMTGNDELNETSNVRNSNTTKKLNKNKEWENQPAVLGCLQQFSNHQHWMAAPCYCLTVGVVEAACRCCGGYAAAAAASTQINSLPSKSIVVGNQQMCIGI